MPGEIFDQDRPQRRSAMARRLDEAFDGCEEWTLAPASRRSADAIDLAPWLSPIETTTEERVPRAA